MDNEFYNSVDERFDDLLTRIKAIEDLLLKNPQIILQPDPSRPVGILSGPNGITE